MESFAIRLKDVRKLNSRCPKCGSREFAILRSHQEDHLCQGCSARWHVCEPRKKLFVKKPGETPIDCEFNHKATAKY